MSKRIIVVGGGAGGLELVVRLARKLKRAEDVSVMLIDMNASHIWKPLLHEVATGSLDSHHDETSYRMLARKHQFDFLLGRVVRVDSDTQQVIVAAEIDENGAELVAERSLSYDQLVLSPGSRSNDFGTEGVAQHCITLDSREQAERFHQLYLKQLHRVSGSSDPDAELSVVIVGGGATGVELAADLHNVAGRLQDYGFRKFSKERLKVAVIEAGAMLLPQLPQRIGLSIRDELQSIGVSVQTDTRIARVESDALITSDGERIGADISVWAAGIKAPAFLADSGFACDGIGRVKVNPDLTLEGHSNVYGLGDCCNCPTRDGGTVPPRAQSAHQMASVLANNILASRRGKPAREFVYKDFGSLISLSRFSTIGNLMGNLVRGTVFVEGWLARLFYLSLYRMHQNAVHGPVSTLLIMLGDRIHRATRAELKLH
ncbi:NAD(P)/FAD-dependent oxidoreductase [Granulosicoccus sp. 3-233]|uniref:NAD(P)/FAD-dependent oxidoreductase n=1 Tax=Granulosicoccus sp. 3-233 TaxID=3417969 RepID=UPI003D32E223